MNPRKPLSCWQIFAQGGALRKIGFALGRAVLHHGMHDDHAAPADLRCDPAHSDPFPSNWPGPQGFGPFFARGEAGRLGRNSAQAGWGRAPRHGILPFVLQARALESGDITTPIRGTSSCGKSSSFFLSQRRLPAACRTPARAGLPVRSLARPLPMPRTKTCWPVRPLAGWQGRLLAPFPARSAADPVDLTARAAAGFRTNPATHGDIPRGWLFHFPPARAALT